MNFSHIQAKSFVRLFWNKNKNESVSMISENKNLKYKRLKTQLSYNISINKTKFVILVKLTKPLYKNIP